MAKDTSKDYRNQVMYSVFVRNHSDEGTFEGVRKDLDRIKDLGVDMVWLMPIHPVGEQARKGSVGSPYANQDYRAVNPEFGTIDDLKRLVSDMHDRGMKCVIDVVYNHTSPDSWLAKNHPEWFYHDENGVPTPRIKEWSDVVDLDYSNPELWDYQIESLKQWAQIVDGFRCDVAPLIPIEFWQKAREEVEKVHPGFFWLSESVEGPFIVASRAQGIPMLSDSEIYQAFDAAYDYDIYWDMVDAIQGELPLSAYAQDINRQEYIYPDNFVKLRFLENHDKDRANSIITDEASLENWTAFMYFQKGLTLVYAGQEVESDHTPSLFEIDKVNWDTGRDLSGLMRKLYEIKKNPIVTDSRYDVKAYPSDIMVAQHVSKENKALIGIFSMRAQSAAVPVDVPDGTYKNLIDGAPITVKDGQVATSGSPIIFEAEPLPEKSA